MSPYRKVNMDGTGDTYNEKIILWRLLTHKVIFLSKVNCPKPKEQ